MSIFTVDYSKLSKYYFKDFLTSPAKVANFAKHILLNQKVTYSSSYKYEYKTSKFQDYGEHKITIYGKKLNSYSGGKYTKYTENLGSKLGVLEITSKKGLSISEAISVVNSDSWATSQNFTIKANQYQKEYGQDYNFSGNNTFLGSFISEKVNGGDGKDKLYGNNGNDNLYGENGNDIIYGGKGKDKILGGFGNDKIYGGNDSDFLYGGKGKDQLVGGKGKDIFKLSKGKGYDLIKDFKDKEDKILIGSIKKLKLKNKGKNVYIYTGKDLLAKIKGAKGDLSKKGKYLVWFF